MNCPDRQQLEELVEGELPPRLHDICAKHLEDCPVCNGIVTALLDERGLFASAALRLSDPGAFAARVLERLRNGEGKDPSPDDDEFEDDLGSWPPPESGGC